MTYLKHPYHLIEMTQYKDEIDRIIIQILFSEKRPYKFRELRREVGRIMNHPNISFDTFNLHLKRMVYGRIIQKSAKGYTLTKEWRNKIERGLSIDPKSYKYLNRSIDDNPWL
jgi:hypothetical protein